MKSFVAYAIFVVFNIIFIPSNSASGFTELPQIVVSRDKDLDFVGGQAGFLFDHQQQFSDQDILRPEVHNSLQRVHRSVPNLSYENGAVWMVLRLTNLDNTSIRAHFHLDYPILDDLQASLWHNNTRLEHIRVKHSQFSVPPQFKNRNPIFSLSLPPGESLFILRIQSITSIILPLSIRTEQGMLDTMLSQNAGLGVAYGVLVGMIFYNLFLAVSLWNLSYAIYVVFIALSTLNFATLHGISQEFFPQEWHNLISRSVAPVGHSTILLLLLFSLRFLELRQSMPKTFRFFQFLMVLSLLGLVGFWFSYRTSIRLYILLSMVCSISLLVSGIFRIFHGYRPAYFFTAAWFTVLLGHLSLGLFVLGLMPANIFSSWGAFIGSVIEVVVLSLALGDKFRYEQRLARIKISNLNQELAAERDQVLQLNQGLERLVEAKTQKIRSILKNIRQGIFTIDSIKGDIGEETSDFLQEIISYDQHKIPQLDSFLFAHSDLRADERQQVIAALSMTLDEDSLAWGVNEDKFPRSLKIQDTQGGATKALELDWNPVLDRHGKIERILVCLRDVTSFQELQKDVAAQEERFHAIKTLIDMTEQKFFGLREQILGLLGECKDLLKSDLSDWPHIHRRVSIHLHTIKGTARTYGIKPLAEATHHAEDLWIKNSSGIDTTLFQQELNKLESILTIYHNIGVNDLNWIGERSGVLIDTSLYNNFLHGIDQLVPENLVLNRLALFQGEGRRLLTCIGRDLAEIIGDFRLELRKTAKELDKDPPTIEVSEGGVVYHSQGTKVLTFILGHLLRNSLDHGLEVVAERLRLKKLPTGCIRIQELWDSDGLTIVFSDDGKGLDFNAIREKACRAGLSFDSDREDAIVECLFLSGFSTKDQVSQISGRGVGLDAVRSIIREEGGDVRIVLLDQIDMHRRSFEFRIKIPENLYWNMSLSADRYLSIHPSSLSQKAS